MVDNGRNHLGTIIWKHHRIDPDAPMESSLSSYEILPPRNDSLQQDTGLSDNDSPEHHHTGPRIDSPETKNTSSTSRLRDRSFRPDPAMQRHLLEEHTIDQEHTNPEENRASTLLFMELGVTG